MNRSPCQTTTEGKRSPDITYGAVPLALNGSTYWWRIKFWDIAGLEGEFSTSTASFTMFNPEQIQELSYTYDAVGNILEITNSSPNNASSVATLAYDDLYRLVSVSVTGTPEGIEGYDRSYTYDALGSMLNASDQGDYTYGTAGYANPHAALSIGSTGLAYDANGNLVSATTSTSGVFFAWDWRNRLSEVGDGTTTSTYGYDHTDQRVKVTVDGTTTYYPTKYYNITSTSVTKHIFANGELIATVTGTGTNAVVNYIHSDHLGGANVVTDETGDVAQLLDYYPYGDPRLDEQTSHSEQRTFIGEQYDSASGLSYLNARYYNGVQGRFLSQDPIFQLVGDQGFSRKFGSNWRFVRGLDQQALQQYLANPQNLNSYSYAVGNPLRYSDPSGELAFLPVLLGVFWLYSAADLYVDGLNYKTVVLDYPEQFTEGEINKAGFDLISDFIFLGYVGRVLPDAADIAMSTVDAASDGIVWLKDRLEEEDPRGKIKSREAESELSSPASMSPTSGASASNPNYTNAQNYTSVQNYTSALNYSSNAFINLDYRASWDEISSRAWSVQQ